MKHMRRLMAHRHAAVVFLCLALLSSRSAHSQSQQAMLDAANGLAMKRILQLAPSPGNPRNSEGDFVRLKDGNILFVYTHFTGASREDDAKAHLAARVSTDGGWSWTPEDRIVAEPGDALNVMSVSLVRLPRGEIGLFYLVKRSHKDCRPVLRRSSDEGRTWSEPAEVIRDEVGYYVLNNDRVVLLKSGRLVAPVALHKGADGAFQPRAEAMCYLSDDFGRTWRRSRSVLTLPADVKSNTGFQEPGVVQRDDGSLLMLCRTDLGSQYVSTSSDGGETWSAPEPSAIRSPASPASIARIPSTGDLLLVWNDNYDPSAGWHVGKRTPLTAAVSRDGGRTWTHRKVLEDAPDGSYCYTAIEFVAGRVLLAYCTGGLGTSGTVPMQVTTFSLDWLYR